MESSWSRAQRDSNKWLLDHLFAWFLAFIIPGMGTVLATLLIPEDSSPNLVALLGFLGGLAGLVLLVLVIYGWNWFRAPYRQRDEVISSLNIREQEIKRLTEKRLIISLSESRYDYLDNQWIRLRVENPTAIPIPECYGKLIRYRLASWESRKDGELLEEIQVSPEEGIHTRRQSGELPPQRHMFAWSTDDLPENTIIIPGHNSFEFLYIAMKRKGEGCFFTPTEMGLRYPNFGLGNFELEMDIGSNSEPFRPTKVKLMFRAGGDLEAKKFEVLPD